MNVPLPGQNHGGSFAVIVLVSLAALGALLHVFWRRDWL